MGDVQHLDLPITTLGLVMSVGRTWRAASAAMAAGIARPRPIDHFTVLDEDAQALEALVPVVGHPVRGFTEGFSLAARWHRLAFGAWDDAACTGGLPPAGDPSWQRTAILAVLPHPNNPRFQDEERGGMVALDEAFALPFASRLGLARAPRQVVAMTHAGLAVALARAAEEIASGAADRAVVVAADSYLDPLTLRWLAEASRLKGPERATGLVPGEAAAVVVVESEASARRRKAPVLARVRCVVQGREAASALTGEPNSGVGLAQALAALTTVLPRPFRGEAYLNSVARPGGPASGAAPWCGRAGSWTARGCTFRPPPSVTPARPRQASGSASPSTASCGAARGGPSLVVSSADWGEIGCIVLAGSVT